MTISIYPRCFPGLWGWLPSGGDFSISWKITHDETGAAHYIPIYVLIWRESIKICVIIRKFCFSRRDARQTARIGIYTNNFKIKRLFIDDVY